MKPQLKEILSKKILALAHERSELYFRLQSPLSLSLDEPIQKGWLRRHVLTPEAEQHSDVLILQEIIQRIGTVKYHWRRDFRKPQRGRRVIEIKPLLENILVYLWDKDPLQYPDRWKRFFHLEYLQGTNPITNCHRHSWYYVINNPGWFELRVEPHWLTHYTVLDIESIRRIKEIETWMRHNNGWNIFRRLRTRRRWRYWAPIVEKRFMKDPRGDRRFKNFPEEVEMRLLPSFHRSFFWIRFLGA